MKTIWDININTKQILTRFEDMFQKRSKIDQNWWTYQKQFESIWVPYSNWKAKSNIPLEYTVIENVISELRKKPADIKISTEVPEQKKQAKVMQKVWEYDYNVNNREKEMLKDDYICACFWTSILFDDLESSSRILSDIVFSENWEITTKKMMERKIKLITKSIDIRDFWVDDRVNSFDEALDCVYRIYMPYDKFKTLKNNPNFNKEAVEWVSPTQQTNQYMTFIRKEETFLKDNVEILMYFNKEADRQILIANRSFIIRDTPLLNPKKELPFTVRQCFYNPFSVYGRWYCELLMSIKSDINTLKEMIMEAIKRSNNQVFAVGWWLNFDGEDFNLNNSIIKFDWVLQGNFEQITWQAPNQAIFNYMQELYKDVWVFSWIDITALVWNSSKTAYQTAIQQELATKRVNNIIYQRDIALERWAEIHLWYLQQFFPLKLVRDLIPMNGDKLQTDWLQATFPTIPLNIKEQKEFWIEDELFEITPDKIRWNFKVDVRTNFNQPTLQQVKKDDLTNWLNVIAQISQLAQTSKEIADHKDELIKEASFLYNIDIEMWMDDEEIKKGKEELMNNLMQMNQSLGNAPAPQEQGQISQTQQVNNIPTPPLPHNPLEQWKQ